jgi:antibiotic biosynthesis monooxygenase (ABM) superfamily enzyme
VIVSATKGQNWMYVLPFDVDSKNGIDVIVGSKHHGTASWLESPENPRDLAAWKLHKIADAGWILSLQAVEVDGDRQDDIVVSDRSGSH